MEELRDFVADVLDSEGAVVERIEPQGLEALLPEHLRAALGWEEHARLGFGLAVPAGAIALRLEGGCLDRFGILLGERGRFAERQLAAREKLAPPNDPKATLDRAIDLPNATWRLHGSAPAWTRCLLLAFRFSAIADEKREGLIWTALNLGTSAVLDGEILRRVRDLLAGSDWIPADAEIRRTAGAFWSSAALGARLQAVVTQQVKRDLEGFVNAARRRLDRDRGRIHEYHDDLRRAAQLRLAALASATGEKAEAARRRETVRISAIEREYGAKLDDLRNNYALRVTVDWVQALVVYVPVHRYALLIKRRKGERIIHLDWHVPVRMIEPPPCDWGAGAGRTRFVCDDHLHLTDASDQLACRSCGKAWCRACHEHCPRCRRPRQQEA
jgi:hypothetical protein